MWHLGHKQCFIWPIHLLHPPHSVGFVALYPYYLISFGLFGRSLEGLYRTISLNLNLAFTVWFFLLLIIHFLSLNCRKTWNLLIKIWLQRLYRVTSVWGCDSTPWFPWTSVYAQSVSHWIYLPTDKMHAVRGFECEILTAMASSRCLYLSASSILAPVRQQDRVGG